MVRCRVSLSAWGEGTVPDIRYNNNMVLEDYKVVASAWPGVT